MNNCSLEVIPFVEQWNEYYNLECNSLADVIRTEMRYANNERRWGEQLWFNISVNVTSHIKSRQLKWHQHLIIIDANIPFESMQKHFQLTLRNLFSSYRHFWPVLPTNIWLWIPWYNKCHTKSDKLMWCIQKYISFVLKIDGIENLAWEK